MKYTDKNKPLVCMMTQSTCYKGTSIMQVKGVLWHSTGANNTSLKRYVQPDDNAPDRTKLISLLGSNPYNNDWNHISHQAGLNAWIGQLADGTVTTVQTMPWNYRPWGCGAGSKGSCNSGWIQFEICEDGLNDRNYFEKVYKEACELTAYLCKMHGIDPKGTVNYNGVTVPTILCHQDSYRLGLGSNHGDVLHWFPKFGKTMADVRNDVAALIKGDASGGSSSSGSDSGNSSGNSSSSTATAAIYRVRRIWADVKSQKGAYKVLDNAKKCADKNPGYSVFDENGRNIYTSGGAASSGASSSSTASSGAASPTTPSKFPYTVKVKISDLNYRKGPSTSYASYGFIKPGVYTIVDEQDGWGLLKAYAEKRNGWIYLGYTERV